MTAPVLPDPVSRRDPGYVEYLEEVIRVQEEIIKEGRSDRCLRGHYFTRKNTYVDKRGRRVCRACPKARRHESGGVKIVLRIERLVGIINPNSHRVLVRRNGQRPITVELQNSTLRKREYDTKTIELGSRQWEVINLG